MSFNAGSDYPRAFQIPDSADDFTFIGQDKWHHIAGELRYVSTATQTIVEADVNGDVKVDFSVALDGDVALTVGNFIGVM